MGTSGAKPNTSPSPTQGCPSPGRPRAPDSGRPSFKPRAPPFLHGELERSCLPAPYPSFTFSKMSHITRRLWDQIWWLTQGPGVASMGAHQTGNSGFLCPHGRLCMVYSPSKCYHSPLSIMNTPGKGGAGSSETFDRLTDVTQRVGIEGRI